MLVRAHYAALPLFLRLSVLLDKVVELRKYDSGSYNYRKPRSNPDGPLYSDHAGWAIDHWSARNGIANVWPARLTPNQAKRISAILRTFATPSGELVFGWGASDRTPGVDYPHTYHRLSDPMHFFIRPGITVPMLKATSASMQVQPDGTVRE